MANSEFFESPKQFYNRSSLRRSSLARNPLVLFHKWLEEAIRSYGLDAYSTILATADGRGHPSARVVLLKQVEPAGFVFFTNYQSRKGCDLKVNQIRISEVVLEEAGLLLWFLHRARLLSAENL